MSDKLTGKQKKFADAYIIHLNATEACRLAGYAGGDTVLAVQGSENLRNTKIINYISEQLNAFAMPASEVLMHLTDIARGDIADVINITPEEAQQIGKSHLVKRFKSKTLTTDKGTVKEVEVEMYSRLTALDLLAKYHNLVNRIKIDDWRSQAIEDIRAGKIEYDALSEAFTEDIAAELFKLAGVRTG